MLHSMKDIENCTLGATDGFIGHVKDLYFDDEAWVIRYLIVETGEWLSRRRVLISPFSLNQPNWPEKILPAAITQDQVKHSPNIDTDKPVSRQHEIGYLGYYGYPYYWGGGSLWGGSLHPGAMLWGMDGATTDEYRRTQAVNARTANEASDEHDDPHLRSGNAVLKYHVHSTDGDIGHVQGLLIDEKTWSIRYMIVNTSNWWFGHDVLIAPEWISDMNWAASKVTVDLTRQAVKGSPAYDSAKILNRDEETDIYKHYARDAYWPREAKHESSGPTP